MRWSTRLTFSYGVGLHDFFIASLPDETLLTTSPPPAHLGAIRILSDQRNAMNFPNSEIFGYLYTCSLFRWYCAQEAYCVKAVVFHEALPPPFHGFTLSRLGTPDSCLPPPKIAPGSIMPRTRYQEMNPGACFEREQTS